MPLEPKRGEPSRSVGQLIRIPLKLNPRTANPPEVKETRKGPAFWSDTTPKVRRELTASLSQREIQDTIPAPPSFLGVVSWWPILAFALVATAVLLFFMLIGFVAVFVRELDYMNATYSRLQHWENRLKWAVKHEARGRTLSCKPCKRNWLQWGDACYLRTTAAKSWKQCIAHCEELQASLLIGNTEGEMDPKATNTILSISSSQWPWEQFLLLESFHWFRREDGWHTPEHYWIGLKYNTTQQVWHWADGENLHLRLSALRNEPSSPVEVCVLLANGYTSTRDCNKSNRCLCKTTLE